jgi:hypothetical protein
MYLDDQEWTAGTYFSPQLVHEDLDLTTPFPTMLCGFEHSIRVTWGVAWDRSWIYFQLWAGTAN